MNDFNPLQQPRESDNQAEAKPPKALDADTSQILLAGPGANATQIAGDFIQQSLRWAPMEPIDKHEIEKIARVYIPTPHFSNALETITSQSTVQDGSSVLVLEDEPGIGRRTTAIRLLTEGSDLSLFEIQPDWDSPRTDLLPAQSGSGYLLDLSHEADIPSQFGDHLANLRDKLRTAGSRLIITVTPSLWRKCRDATAHFTSPVGIPTDIDQVIEAHLKFDSGKLGRFIPLSTFPEPLTKIVKKLQEHPSAPSKVLDLVTAMRAETELNDETVQRISHEFHRWSTYLDGQFTKPQDISPAGLYNLARRRALLITVAILDGAPETDIFNSSFELLKHLKAEPSFDELLTGPELTELINDIHAKKISGGITLTHRSPSLDRAVVNRIWRERPGMRSILLTWLATITTDKTMALRHIDRVASVVTALAVEQRSTDVLDELVQRWLSEGTRHRTLAITILDHLSVSPDIGSAVRKRLYDWVKTTTLDPQILSGVAKVCAGQLARQHLNVALVRLRILAMSSYEIVRNAATAALRELTQDSQLRLRVIQNMLAWTNNSSTMVSGQSTFLELMNPRNDDTVFDDIILEIERNAEIKVTVQKVWSQLLGDNTNQGPAVNIMSACLDYADSHPEHHSTILEMVGPGFRSAMAQGAGEALMSNGNSASRVKLVQLLARELTNPTITSPAEMI